MFDKHRRGGSEGKPQGQPESPAEGSPPENVDSVAAPTYKPVDESLLPRWRRPSLQQARKTDPLRNVKEAQSLSFEAAGVQPLGEYERRRIRYRLVRLLDSPDEVRATEIGLVDRGDEVQLLERYGVYWRVLCPDGRQGWVHRMTLADPPEPRQDEAGPGGPESQQQEGEGEPGEASAAMGDADADGLLEAYMRAKSDVLEESPEPPEPPAEPQAKLEPPAWARRKKGQPEPEPAAKPEAATKPEPPARTKGSKTKAPVEKPAAPEPEAEAEAEPEPEPPAEAEPAAAKREPETAAAEATEEPEAPAAPEPEAEAEPAEAQAEPEAPAAPEPEAEPAEAQAEPEAPAAPEPEAEAEPEPEAAAEAEPAEAQAEPEAPAEAEPAAAADAGEPVASEAPEERPEADVAAASAVPAEDAPAATGQPTIAPAPTVGPLVMAMVRDGLERAGFYGG